MKKIYSIGILSLLLSLLPIRSNAQIVVQPQGYISGGGVAPGPISCSTNGTAALPCYTGSTVNSGIYFSGTSTLISVNGTNAFTLSAGGRLDITGALVAVSSVVAGTTANLGFDSSTQLTSPVNGVLNIANNANTAGIGLRVTTDGLLEVRDRANSAGANIIAAEVRTTGDYVFSAEGAIRTNSNGVFALLNAAGSSAAVFKVTGAPTCATNCGTSPTVNGQDTSFQVVMGATGTPASGFVITFNSAWSSAPSCTINMGKAGMVVGKMPLTVVTTTSNITVVTNGTNPANGDIYQGHCIGMN